MNFLSQKHVDILKKSIGTKQYDLKIDELTKKVSKAEKLLTKAISAKYTDLIETCETIKNIKKPINELQSINTNASIYFQEILSKIINQKSEKEKYDSIVQKVNKCLTLIEKIKIFYHSLENIEGDDFYEKMCNLKNMEKQICYFKNFHFYYTLKNIFEVQSAKFHEKLHDEIKLWIDDAQKCYEYVGREAEPVKKYLFDQRYNFIDVFDMKKIKILYFISEKINLKEEIEETINKNRKLYVENINCKSLQALLNIFKGFYILDFYLSKINTGLTLKHQVFSKKIIEIEREQREKLDIIIIKEFYTSLIRFQKVYKFETFHFENELKDLCFEYFMKNKVSFDQFEEKIHEYISKGLEIVKDIDYLCISDVLYKIVDDSACEYLENKGIDGISTVDFIYGINKNFYWRFITLKNEILERIRVEKFSQPEKEIFEFIQKYPKNDQFGEIMEEKLNQINDEYLKNKSTKPIIRDILFKIKDKLQYQQDIAKSSETLTREVKGNFVIFETILQKMYLDLFEIYSECMITS
ncbi:hypothetical protein DMUE_3515 [Dictyocoela muelleri]|nr:hypothetical protein DMUE_3515 [Dictyocoela muelleri]